MKQVAGVQTGAPNVYLEQPQVQTVIENDLRLTFDSTVGIPYSCPGANF
jgi:hypothetical protein